MYLLLPLIPSLIRPLQGISEGCGQGWTHLQAFVRGGRGWTHLQALAMVGGLDLPPGLSEEWEGPNSSPGLRSGQG